MKYYISQEVMYHGSNLTGVVIEVIGLRNPAASFDIKILNTQYKGETTIIEEYILTNYFEPFVPTKKFKLLFL